MGKKLHRNRKSKKTINQKNSLAIKQKNNELDLKLQEKRLIRFRDTVILNILDEYEEERVELYREHSQILQENESSECMDQQSDSWADFGYSEINKNYLDQQRRIFEDQSQADLVVNDSIKMENPGFVFTESRESTRPSFDQTIIIDDKVKGKQRVKIKNTSSQVIQN